MQLYFAPLEGITGYVYRNAHHACFGGVDRYFTPFVVATFTHKVKTREKMDILPQNNTGIPLVPQILSNNADEFLATARYMADFGYPEVNLNLGCPMATVVNKHKGSGFLGVPDELDAFLNKIYNGAEQIRTASGRPLRISVKTRLGLNTPAEFDRIFNVYMQYPLSELIIHARTRKEMYAGRPHLELFRRLLDETSVPLIYNGNIFTVRDAERADALFAGVSNLCCGLMLGRGLLSDPALAEKICAAAGSRSSAACAAAQGAGNMPSRTDARGAGNAASGGGAARNCAADTAAAGSRSGAAAADTDAASAIIGAAAADAGRSIVNDKELPHLSCSGASSIKDMSKRLRGFHDALYQGYQEQYQGFHGQHSGETVVINRMKEVWTFMGSQFADDARFLKNIHKAKNHVEYEAAVRMIFANCEVTGGRDGL